MFIGISNPFTGLCVLISVAMDSMYICGFYCASVIFGIFWCFYLKINREMIYNGLYPCQCIMVSIYMTLSHANNINLWTELAVLFFLSLIEIITFQTLCELLVVRLKCSPSTIAGILWSLIFMISLRGSNHFMTTNTGAGYVTVWDPEKINITLGLTPKRYAYETLRGAAFYSATLNVYGAIPLFIGIAVGSPILAIGMWVGSFLGIGSAWCIGIDPDEMFNGAYGVNGAVVFANLCSVYFVLNIHSCIIAAVATFGTVLGCIAMNYTLAPTGVGCSVLPAILCILMVYLSRNHFPRLIPVELVCITTPEDHITRYLLSQKIIRHLNIKRHLKSYKHLSSDKLQNLERSLLPILMCSYASKDERKKLNTLLFYNANPNNRDYDGRTPLHIAAAENRVEVTSLLLKYANDINAQDNFGNTAVMESLRCGHYEMAEYLHSLGGCISMPPEKLAAKLCYFVAKGDNKSLYNWLKCGASPNVADYDERTPLHLSYACDNKGALELLVKFGANGEKKDRWGQTPMQGDHTVVLELAAKEPEQRKRPLNLNMSNSRSNMKKSPDAADHDLIAAVILALLGSEDREHIDMLLPSLLCEAAQAGCDDIIREVIHQLDNPNPGDYDGRTPLHLACETGNLQIVRMITKNGAELDCKDRFGVTPLCAATLSGHVEVCHFLREKGATLNMTNEATIELLFWTVHTNDIDLLELVVLNGIDLTCRDYDGRSVFGQAKDVGSKGILSYLMSEDLKEVREFDGQLGAKVETDEAPPLYDEITAGNDVPEYDEIVREDTEC